MATRTKTWRKSASDRVEEALAALPLPPSGSPACDTLRALGVDVDGQRAAQAAELRRTGGGDPHERLAAAVHGRRQGVKRSGGRRAGAKASAIAARYADWIDQLDTAGEPRQPPFTVARRDAIMRALRISPDQTEAFIRYLRRHPRL
jgi:hypothetical protein